MAHDHSMVDKGTWFARRCKYDNAVKDGDFIHSFNLDLSMNMKHSFTVSWFNEVTFTCFFGLYVLLSNSFFPFNAHMRALLIPLPFFQLFIQILHILPLAHRNFKVKSNSTISFTSHESRTSRPLRRKGHSSQ